MPELKYREEMLLVDIPSGNHAMAMRAIELLHQELPDSARYSPSEVSFSRRSLDRAD